MTRLEQPSYCLFESAIGHCAIAWRGDRITRLHLPGATPLHTAERMESLPARLQDPPAAVARLITRLQRHLEGRLDDLRDVSLDLEASRPFAKAVYLAARSVGPGQTSSYREIAELIGSPRAARAVGGALGANPIALIVPCHRILSANRTIGGFSAHGGTVTKIALLAIEGVAWERRRPVGNWVRRRPVGK